MTRQLLNTGIIPNDGQGDSLRDAGGKINSNFSELYTALGNGTALTVVNNNLLTATGQNKISFLYNELADLPSASTYHGMFAHVHSESASYYAHNGAWVQLADENKSINMFADVDTSTTPTTGQALIWDAGAEKWKPGNVAAQGGGGGGGAETFTDLTDTPGDYGGLAGGFLRVNGQADGLEIVAAFSINALSDVDTSTTTPVAGQVLKWNGTNWVPAADSTSGGGSTDAGTLDGLDSTYFLNYNNLNNKPSLVTTLTGLTDTPSTYTGAAGRFVKVNGAGTGLEFSTATTGATILTDLNDVNLGLQTFNVTGANYTGATGVLTMTIGTHSLTVGQKVIIKGSSIVFTCATDGNATTHAYPRVTDPAYNTPVAITSTTATSITVNVGVSPDTSAHSFVSATSNAVSVAPSQGNVLYFNGTRWEQKNGPVITWKLGANGTSDYTFTGPGFPTPATTDPVLYLSRGHTYVFENLSGGSHPFQIRVSNGGAAYTSGVTNNGASTGNIVFEVPMDAPNTLYYQCTSHSTMGNTINIVS
jgi:hypothetical protein